MRIHRVAVVGSSISLLVRPAHDGLPYPRLLEVALNSEFGGGSDVWIVNNYSRVAAVINDVGHFLEEIVSLQPEIVVLHYGYNEALFRPHSRRSWKIAYYRRPGRSVHVRTLAHLVRFTSGIRRRLKWGEHWIDLDQYGQSLRETIDYIQKECRARIVLVGLNPESEPIENYIRTGTKRIPDFEALTALIADEKDVLRVNVIDAIRADTPKLMPDGTHFSGEGHQLVAMKITDALRPSLSVDFSTSAEGAEQLARPISFLYDQIGNGD